MPGDTARANRGMGGLRRSKPTGRSHSRHGLELVAKRLYLSPDTHQTGTSTLDRDPKKPAKAEPSRSDGDQRIAPDPFAIVLPAIAALGAISSIAAINWMAQEKTPDRAKARRKAGMALRDLESCCLGLTEIFRRFARNPKLFCGESSQAPLKFGVHGTRVEAGEARLYQQLMNDVASMLVLASHNSFELMSAIEDGEIEAPETVFYGFGEQQERLNKLISQRAPLKSCVEAGGEVADKLTQLVRELKKHRVET